MQAERSQSVAKSPSFWVQFTQSDGKIRYIGYHKQNRGNVMSEAIALQRIPEVESVKVLIAVPAPTYQESVQKTLEAIAQ